MRAIWISKAPLAATFCPSAAPQEVSVCLSVRLLSAYVCGFETIRLSERSAALEAQKRGKCDSATCCLVFFMRPAASGSLFS